MAVKILASVQMASNLNAAFEGEDVSEVVQAIQQFGTALEANLTPTPQATPEEGQRKGLIIPEIKVQGPIREDDRL